MLALPSGGSSIVRTTGMRGPALAVAVALAVLGPGTARADCRLEVVLRDAAGRPAVPGLIVRGSAARPWGVLSVSDSAFARTESGHITAVQVAAPADPAVRPLKGDRWMLELKPSWTVAAGARVGDFEVRKVGP